MTDKIKIKADKFVNDKKLKLNYIKPKDLKLLLTEFCEEQIAELKAECDLAIEGRDVKIKELEAEKKLNAEIKARFVKCNTCTDEMKSKCLMFSENLCEGERCEELVDLMGLISKSELETRCNELFLQTCEQAEKIKELQEELKKWKDEWQKQVQKATDEGYARTLQTMQLSKAKEIIKTFLAIVNNDVEYVQNPQDCKDLWKELCEKAEQFIKDSEV